MPLYSYRCGCGKVVETLFKSWQEAQGVELKCSCGGLFQRQVSSGGFILKGTGFYKTDYAASVPPNDSKD